MLPAALLLYTAIVSAITTPAAHDTSNPVASRVPANSRPATYKVSLANATSLRLAVVADLPMDGQAIAMDRTRPGDIPELDAHGWPALIVGLRVSDAAGRPVEVSSVGDSGWQLTKPYSGRLTLRYEVDYSALAAQGWPAPREAALADSGELVLIGRSLFLTTRNQGASDVTFTLPPGWRPVTAWAPSPNSEREFSVRTATELVENLVVLSRTPPDIVAAGGFRLLVMSMGHWQPSRGEVRRVVGAVVPRLVGLMGLHDRENYLVVLLPIVEHGGESYRQSFALTVDAPPSRENSATWGNTIAHEVFHYWNGGRVRAAEYAESQWFHEGFTEYAANLSMLEAGLVGPDDFMRKLAGHIGNSHKLATTLEAPGSHKGPPLYSAGALVAFSWDVLIRQASGGKRNIGDFFKALWRQTDSGRREYRWPDIRAALVATTPHDWEQFYAAYIRGNTPLPLSDILPLAGLRLEQASGGIPAVVLDPAAPASAKALWRGMVAGH